jgi:hypothetical protein
VRIQLLKYYAASLRQYEMMCGADRKDIIRGLPTDCNLTINTEIHVIAIQTKYRATPI